VATARASELPHAKEQAMKVLQVRLVGLLAVGVLGVACSSNAPANNGTYHAAGGMGDSGGTTTNGGDTSAGGIGGETGLDAGNASDAGDAGNGGLLQGAENYQGDYPQPGTVTYTDRDGTVVTVPAIPGHVLLFVPPTMSRSDAGAMLSALGAEVRACIPMVGYYLAGVTPGSEGDLISALRNDRRTIVASPDIIIGPDSTRVLHTLDDKCPSPPTAADQDTHGSKMVKVLNKYANGQATGLCEDISFVHAYQNEFSLLPGPIAMILDQNAGSAYMNLSWGPKREYLKAGPIAEQDKTLVTANQELWGIVFTELAAARSKYSQSNSWDTVLTVSAGNDNVDVTDAVRAVARDPVAGGALANNGMLVGVVPSVFPDSNKARGEPDLVQASNPEAEAGTSDGAPFALAMASNLAVGTMSGTEAVCLLKRAARSNDQMLPGPDLSALDQSSCSLRAESVAAGEKHTCAKSRNGTLRCWGFNAGGPLGNGAMLTVYSTTPVSVLNITDGFDISAGFAHTCGLLRDRTIWCWGDNEYGQLGNNSSSQYSYTPLQVWDSTGSIAITAGGWHSCTVLRDGSTWCWGKNDCGQLGNGTTTNSRSPVAVASGGIRAWKIAAGGSHTCTVAFNGAVWCWGMNDSGELGNGTTTDSPSPVPVATSMPAADVAAGCCSSKYQHTCALLIDGTIECWGDNEAGELGGPSKQTCGTQLCSNLPVTVVDITDATAVAVGELHSCAIRSDQTVWCWGSNMQGELGNTTIKTHTRQGVDATNSDDDYKPVQVTGISGAISIGARGFHTCAVLQDGSVWCWGTNEFGQLGNGTQTSSPAPVRVSGT
jgi:alpha-tubulin suppressor-like RCC1 family protein